MRDRPRARVAAPALPRVTCALDLVGLVAERRELAVLLIPAGAKGWQLPAAAWRPGAALDDAGAALARRVFGREAAWNEQCGTFTAGTHPAGAQMSVACVAIVPRGTPAPAGASWHSLAKLPASLAARQRAEIASAMRHVTVRMDFVPIAFRLLPPAFTLGALQEMYELLLGRKLHKASFRRALQAAFLVEPTDEWRGDGRGRPAQLYRFAPRRRRAARRIVRFEVLGA